MLCAFVGKNKLNIKHPDKDSQKDKDKEGGTNHDFLIFQDALVQDLYIRSRLRPNNLVNRLLSACALHHCYSYRAGVSPGPFVISKQLNLLQTLP